jgi:hypothetical protein
LKDSLRTTRHQSHAFAARALFYWTLALTRQQPHAVDSSERTDLEAAQFILSKWTSDFLLFLSQRKIKLPIKSIKGAQSSKSTSMSSDVPCLLKDFPVAVRPYSNFLFLCLIES